MKIFNFFKNNSKINPLYFICEQYFDEWEWPAFPYYRPVNGWGCAIKDRNTAERAARDIFIQSKGKIKTVVFRCEEIYRPSI